MDSVFRGSFLQFDITPNVSQANPAFLQGMAGGLRQSTAVAIPLSIELCMLEDRNYTKLLFVTADIIGFDKDLVNEVRRHAALWGIEPEGIVMNASHTHYAPGTLSNMPQSMGPFYATYASQILKLIVTNLRSLYDNLEPCEILYGKAEAQIGVNRRFIKEGNVYFAPNPEGVYIKDTPLIRIGLKSSGRKIIWVSHGCHPTGMGMDTRISSDFVGFTKYELKRNKIADDVMFFQGAGGSSKEAAKRNDRWKFCDNINDVRKNGFTLASIVKETVYSGLKPIEGQFFSRIQNIELPLSREDAPEIGNEKLQALPIEVQLVSIGDQIKMLTFPMEMVAEFAQIIQKSGLVSTQDFLLGYTNGLDGYLSNDRMLEAGGYEAEKSHLVYQKPAALALGTEKKVVDSIRTLQNEQKKVNLDNGYGRYHQTKKSKKAFFVLSSGRCGTMTLAHLLNTADNARVWHHPQPDPIKEALLAWWGEIDFSTVFWRSRRSTITKSWAEGLVHGETDLLMTPFFEIIDKEIPESKFIILVRNPKGFVQSGMRRNYYYGHPWDFGRLRPKENSKEYETWNAFNQFERVCWLWNETYSRINRIHDIVNKERVLTVKFEDLVSDYGTIENLFEFLNLKKYKKGKIEKILSKKLNKQVDGNFPESGKWDEKMIDTLKDICSENIFRYDYKI